MGKAIDNPQSDAHSGGELAGLSDEELLGRYRKQGDRQAFAVLVHRYERELYSYLRQYLGDATLAEDAFQATFLQVHLKCDQFEEGRKFRPWVYTIATNQAINAAPQQAASQRQPGSAYEIRFARRRRFANRPVGQQRAESRVAAGRNPAAQLDSPGRG